MIHVFDNDTSGLQDNLRRGQFDDGARPMWTGVVTCHLYCVFISVNKSALFECFSIGRYKSTGKEEEMECEKSLLSVDEFCQYVGIGKTKAREMLANPCCKYAVRIGRRVFVHKELFDEEVKKSAKFQLTM